MLVDFYRRARFGSSRPGLWCSLVFVLFFASPGLATADGFTFEKVADGSTPIPNGAGAFVNFATPSLSGDNVAFRATGENGQVGIYARIGGTLKEIAAKNTLIPGGTGSFTEFFDPTIEGDQVAFRALGPNGQQGVYVSDGTSLRLIADRNTPIPGGTGNFDSLVDSTPDTGFGGSVSLDHGDIAFYGSGGASEGIYSNHGGTLHALVDTSTVIPGTSSISTVVFSGVRLGLGLGSRPPTFSVNDGNLAFWAGNITQVPGQEAVRHAGIYTNTGGELHAIVTDSTPLPNGTGTFGLFVGGVALDGNEVAFVRADPSFLASSLNPPGPEVFKTVGGTLQEIIGPDLLPPGLEGRNLAPILPNGLGFDQGHLLFVAAPAPPGNAVINLYTDLTGALTKVIGTGDHLDGRPVGGPLIGNQTVVESFRHIYGVPSISGNRFAFDVTFLESGWPQAVYVAAVPEPSGIALALSAVVGTTCVAYRTKSRICRTRAHHQV